MAKWSASDIPAQSGRTVVITGTGGLGYETALELARKGADVTLAGRNADKGRASIEAVRGQVPRAKIKFAPLDLADLKSVPDFVAQFSDTHAALDLLVN